MVFPQLVIVSVDDALVTGFEEVVYPGYQSLPRSSLTPGSQYSGQANL